MFCRYLCGWPRPRCYSALPWVTKGRLGTWQPMMTFCLPVDATSKKRYVYKWKKHKCQSNQFHKTFVSNLRLNITALENQEKFVMSKRNRSRSGSITSNSGLSFFKTVACPNKLAHIVTYLIIPQFGLTFSVALVFVHRREWLKSEFWKPPFNSDTLS